jgi:putative ABC transport system permease protein
VNPLPILRAQLKTTPVGFTLIVVLIAIAISLGIAASALERSLREGSGKVADTFDLIVGAPGSQAQLVLTAVFLQPAALPLMPGSVIEQIAQEPGVDFYAPFGMGDRHGRSPIVGSTAAFLTRGGRQPLIEGREFRAKMEAVIGATVDLRMGDSFEPQHGMEGEDGHDHSQPSEDTHEGFRYTVVGRMAATGTPWDRAIIVPIEAVWDVHGLGTGHAPGVERIGPPWQAGELPGVVAVIVKPRGVADAYRLRSKYRTGGTMAVFPAEVMIEMYGVMDTARSVLTLVAVITQILVVCSIILAVTAALDAQRQKLAVLRALGASRSYLLVSVWLYAVSMLAVGTVLGLGFGWALAKAIATWLSARTGTVLWVNLAPSDVELLGLLLLVGLIGALVPAWRAYRQPVAAALRA